MAKVKRAKKKSRILDTWHQLKKNKLAVISLFVLVAIFIVAILAPVLAPYGFDEVDSKNAMAGSSKEHLLGTDRLGRDVLSRLLYGASQSLQMGIIAILVSAVAGIFIGAIAGYFGGWLDNLLLR